MDFEKSIVINIKMRYNKSRQKINTNVEVEKLEIKNDKTRTSKITEGVASLVIPDMVKNLMEYCEKGKCPESQGKSISN